MQHDVSKDLEGAYHSEKDGNGTRSTRHQDGAFDDGEADVDNGAEDLNAFDEGEDEEDEDEAMASSDDEEYNLNHFGIAQALPVPDGPPNFDAGPPQTAEEYLQWVRFEASRCPRITRKEVDPAVLERHQQRRQQAPAGGDGDAATPGGLHSGSGGEVDGVAAGTGNGPGGRRRGASTAFAARVPPPVISECPEWARPSHKWLAAFLQDFCRLRQALSAMQLQHARELSVTALPSLDNAAAWDRLCFEQWQPLEQQQQAQAQRQDDEMATDEEPEEGDEGPPPPPPPPPPPVEMLHGGGPGPSCGAGSTSGSGSLAADGHQGDRCREEQLGESAVSSSRGGGGGAGAGGVASSSGRPVPAPRQDQGQGDETDRLCGPVVRTVLALDQVSVGSLIQRHVTQLGSQPCLSYIRSQWLFALAAVLERPVPPDVAAAMRDLVRRCAAWRATLEHPGDPVLPRLNVLLAVAGGYFGQDEQLSAAAAAAGLGDFV